MGIVLWMFAWKRLLVVITGRHFFLKSVSLSDGFQRPHAKLGVTGPP